MNSKTKKWLVILLAICLVCTVCASLVQHGFGSVSVKAHNMTFTEMAAAIRENNSTYRKNVEVSFTENAFYNFHFTEYRPKTATDAAPAPAIVMCHGMNNVEASLVTVCIELSRRGFVVFNVEGAGHGKTDYGVNDLSHNTWGIEAAVEYAMSLGYVDTDAVAVTGHSRGGTMANATLAQVNANTSNHIRAYLSGSALKNLTNLSAEITEGVVFGLSDGFYEEGDSKKWLTAQLLTNKDGLGYSFIRCAYPEFDEDQIPEGVFFTADGALPTLDIASGESLTDVDTCRVLYNPRITHLMWAFCHLSMENTITFFYSAFGTPTGANYLAPSNQIWGWSALFTGIAMLSFFALLFPLASALLSTSLFSKLRRKEEGLALPPFNWKECILWILCVVIMAAYSYNAYPRDSLIAESYVSNVTLPYGPAANAAGNANALYNLDMGVFAMVMLLAVCAVRKVFYRKNVDTQSNPFVYAKLDSVTQFFTVALFAFVLVGLMYVPVFIAARLFNVGFQFNTIGVADFRLIRIPTMLKYIPFWGLFWFVHAVMNAGFRYRNVPDWLSTLGCAIGNVLGIAIFMAVQYHGLFTVGWLHNPSASSPTTFAWSILIPSIFGAVSSRFLYNKTHNAWVPALCNTVLMVTLTLSVLASYSPYWFI